MKSTWLVALSTVSLRASAAAAFAGTTVVAVGARVGAAAGFSPSGFASFSGQPVAAMHSKATNSGEGIRVILGLPLEMRATSRGLWPTIRRAAPRNPLPPGGQAV